MQLSYKVLESHGFVALNERYCGDSQQSNRMLINIDECVMLAILIYFIVYRMF